MYQYIARLKASKELIAEGHTVEDIEHQIVRFKRGIKRGEHTRDNEQIEIVHVHRDQVGGNPTEKLVKVV